MKEFETIWKTSIYSGSRLTGRVQITLQNSWDNCYVNLSKGGLNARICQFSVDFQRVRHPTKQPLHVQRTRKRSPSHEARSTLPSISVGSQDLARREHVELRKERPFYENDLPLPRPSVKEKGKTCLF